MRIFSILVALFSAAGLAGETPPPGRPRILYIDAAELQRAVDEAPPHSVLMADRGQQVEVSATIRIEKPLTLVGLNARLKPGLEKTPMIEVLSEGVAIRDFTLEAVRHTLAADAVESRSLHNRVAQDAGVRIGLVVRESKEYVGAFRRRLVRP